MPAVCVYCASNPQIPGRYVELAAHVGQEIASRQWSLVSGGGSESMMGAVARATRLGGGRTIGVIPQALIEYEVADHDSDELIVTSTMRERKAIMDDRADAFLALPGGIGTLEELMEVWTSRHLRMHTKPVVVLDPWGDFDLLRAQVEHWQKLGFVKEHAVAELLWTTSVHEACDAIQHSWTSTASVPHSG
ncbi:MAG: TIGR00730 family Rossman fold protein [Actinomycetota bacterium]|nr:TIGR00730 family Rossman fold protein [Actinomycetota bacterium]